MLSLQTVLPDTLELLRTLMQMPELGNMRLVVIANASRPIS